MQERGLRAVRWLVQGQVRAAGLWGQAQGLREPPGEPELAQVAGLQALVLGRALGQRGQVRGRGRVLLPEALALAQGPVAQVQVLGVPGQGRSRAVTLPGRVLQLAGTLAEAPLRLS